MFCANTRPVPFAATDFGEIGPVTFVSSESAFALDGTGGSVVVVTGGSVVVVDVVVVLAGWRGVETACVSSPAVIAKAAPAPTTRTRSAAQTARRRRRR